MFPSYPPFLCRQTHRNTTEYVGRQAGPIKATFAKRRGEGTQRGNLTPIPFFSVSQRWQKMGAVKLGAGEEQEYRVGVTFSLSLLLLPGASFNNCLSRKKPNKQSRNETAIQFSPNRSQNLLGISMGRKNVTFRSSIESKPPPDRTQDVRLSQLHQQ